jgi:Mg2+ and Co2+ transporter CorA
MAMETRPQEGRPATSAKEAARLLRRDIRTVRRMIEDGELDGGASPGPNRRRRWFVYVDQLPGSRPPTQPRPTPVAPEIAQLREEIAQLRARVMSGDETNRLLVASHATLRDTMAEYQTVMSEILAAADGFRQAADQYRGAGDLYRDSAQHYQRAVSGLQQINTKLNTMLEHYSDALSQHIAPTHAGEIATAPRL